MHEDQDAEDEERYRASSTGRNLVIVNFNSPAVRGRRARAHPSTRAVSTVETLRPCARSLHARSATGIDAKPSFRRGTPTATSLWH